MPVRHFLSASFGEAPLDIGVLRVACKVVQLIAILCLIEKLFTAIFVARVTPALIPNGVVVRPVGSQCWLARCESIFEKRFQAEAVVAGVGREAAEIDKRWI